MDFIKYLPVPSARMGLMWTLLSVEDAVVLETGPAGTTHFGMEFFSSLNEIPPNRLFTTHILEKELILGDHKRIAGALKEIEKEYKPKIIFVVSSSLTSMTGLDIEGICHLLKDEIKTPLIGFNEGGFSGDYSEGLYLSYKALASLAKAPSKISSEKVNIIGLSMGSYRCKSDRAELERLLFEGFGLEVNAFLGAKITPEEIFSLSESRLNIVLRDEGLPAAKLLEKKFKTPYILGSPYGYKGTLNWLEQIENKLEIKLDDDLRFKILKKAKDASRHSLLLKRMGAGNFSAALYGEYSTVSGIGKFLEQNMFDVPLKVSSHSLKRISSPNDDIRYIKDEGERLDIFKNLHNTFILADDITLSICPGDNTFLRISSPVLNGREFAEHLPLMGERGADFLMENLIRYQSFNEI